MAIFDLGPRHLLGLLMFSKPTSIQTGLAAREERVSALIAPDLKRSHESRRNWLFCRRATLLGICGTSLLGLLVSGPLNAMAQLASDPQPVSVVARAIKDLELCKANKKYPEGPKRRQCGYSKIKATLDLDQVTEHPPNACATKSSLKTEEIVSVVECQNWLGRLQDSFKSKKNSEKVSGPSALDREPPVPPAPAKEVAVSTSSSASAPASTASTSTPTETGLSSAASQDAQAPVSVYTPKARDNTNIMSPTIFMWILGALVTAVVATLSILYFRLRSVNGDLEDRLNGRDEAIKKLKSQNKQLNDELAHAKESRADLKQPVAYGNGLGSSVAPVLAVPLPEPRTAIASVPPRVERSITSQTVEDVILKAIHALAHERVSLTEANFVAKVAGFASDLSLKAALTERLAPARFYLCSGSRSAQGPELLAYNLKGQTICSVVPFPTAGRVGQFIRWFENAGSAYDVDPVLAARPARGVINEAGSLSVSQPGLLA